MTRTWLTMMKLRGPFNILRAAEKSLIWYGELTSNAKVAVVGFIIQYYIPII